MTIPYRYVKGAAAGRDETCVLCGTRSTRLVVDHCHVHGYARGLLCGSCNSRAGALDAGSAPTSKELFYLGNCPECRKGESIDSPHALTLRVGAVALAVATALDLSPRQSAALALSLAGDTAQGERRSRLSPAGEKRERLSPARVGEGERRETLATIVRRLRETSRDESEIRKTVLALPGYESTKPDTLRKVLFRTRPKNCAT